MKKVEVGLIFFLNGTKVKHRLHGGSTLRIKNKRSAEKTRSVEACKLQLKKKKVTYINTIIINKYLLIILL